MAKEVARFDDFNLFKFRKRAIQITSSSGPKARILTTNPLTGADVVLQERWFRIIRDPSGFGFIEDEDRP